MTPKTNRCAPIASRACRAGAALPHVPRAVGDAAEHGARAGRRGLGAGVGAEQAGRHPQREQRGAEVGDRGDHEDDGVRGVTGSERPPDAVGEAGAREGRHGAGRRRDRVGHDELVVGHDVRQPRRQPGEEEPVHRQAQQDEQVERRPDGMPGDQCRAPPARARRARRWRPAGSGAGASGRAARRRRARPRCKAGSRRRSRRRPRPRWRPARGRRRRRLARLTWKAPSLSCEVSRVANSRRKPGPRRTSVGRGRRWRRRARRQPRSAADGEPARSRAVSRAGS